MKSVSFSAKLQANWQAGISVSLVSMPLAVSLAVASHANPLVGIITAIWAGLVASIFGGSNYNIIGPTGALSGILAMYAISHGESALSMLAILTGIFIFIAYLFKLERYLIFFPASTIHGFILGVALTIAFNQLNAAFGLIGLPQHEKFLHNLYESCTHLHSASWITFAFFMFFLVTLFILVKLTPNIPGAIILAPIAIITGAMSSAGWLPFTLQTLQSKYPTLSPILFKLPKLHFSPSLVVPALTIAIVAILETMISARIADGLTKTKHNKRREMFGLGLANLVSGLAGGIPATAALARTALNIKAGATDKIAATISSICIALIALLFLTFFKYIPMAAIAAMLVFVSVKMIEKEHFLRLFRVDKKNFILSLVVAFITVYEDPIVGLLLGATIAMLIFMEKISQGHFEVRTTFPEIRHQATISQMPTIPKAVTKELQKTPIPTTNTLVYAIKGQLAYINAQSHIAQLEQTPEHYKNIILDLRGLHFIDLDGVEAFGEIINHLHQLKKVVGVSCLRPFIAKMLQESHEFKVLKEQSYVFPTTDQALLFLNTSK
jgi:SulP family sulfate permease